jgi:hypothetical protein
LRKLFALFGGEPLKTSRTILPIAAVAVFAVAAQAQTAYSNINATYTLNPGGSTFNWIVSQNVPPMTIDFTQNAPAFKVGDTTGFSGGTSTITYDVTSSIAITGVDLLLQGNVLDFGRIQWGASAATGAGSLGSISGSILGGSYALGSNGAFTNIYHLQFSQAVTSFSITETFGLDINGQSLPSTSVATLGTVENNFAVPEPGSLAALGLGGLALLRRRRKSK